MNSSGWPMKPFAPNHLVFVKDKNDDDHSIVMSSGGQLFDPHDAAIEGLSDYSLVTDIIGIYDTAGL